MIEAQCASPLWDTGNLQQWPTFFSQLRELDLAEHDGPVVPTNKINSAASAGGGGVQGRTLDIIMEHIYLQWWLATAGSAALTSALGSEEAGLSVLVLIVFFFGAATFIIDNTMFLLDATRFTRLYFPKERGEGGGTMSSQDPPPHQRQRHPRGGAAAVAASWPH